MLAIALASSGCGKQPAPRRPRATARPEKPLPRYVVESVVAKPRDVGVEVRGNLIVLIDQRTLIEREVATLPSPQELDSVDFVFDDAGHTLLAEVTSATSSAMIAIDVEPGEIRWRVELDKWEEQFAPDDQAFMSWHRETRGNDHGTLVTLRDPATGVVLTEFFVEGHVTHARTSVPPGRIAILGYGFAEVRLKSGDLVLRVPVARPRLEPSHTRRKYLGFGGARDDDWQPPPAYGIDPSAHHIVVATNMAYDFEYVGCTEEPTSFEYSLTLFTVDDGASTLLGGGLGGVKEPEFSDDGASVVAGGRVWPIEP